MTDNTKKGQGMQNKTYTITAMIDEEEYTLAQDVPEEELEGELQHLTRKHALKNVGRYELKEASRQAEGAKQPEDCSRAKRSAASRTILNTSSISET